MKLVCYPTASFTAIYLDNSPDAWLDGDDSSHATWKPSCTTVKFGRANPDTGAIENQLSGLPRGPVTCHGTGC